MSVVHALGQRSLWAHSQGNSSLSSVLPASLLWWSGEVLLFSMEMSGDEWSSQHLVVLRARAVLFGPRVLINKRIMLHFVECSHGTFKHTSCIDRWQQSWLSEGVSFVTFLFAQISSNQITFLANMSSPLSQGPRLLSDGIILSGFCSWWHPHPCQAVGYDCQRSSYVGSGGLRKEEGPGLRVFMTFRRARAGVSSVLRNGHPEPSISPMPIPVLNPIRSPPYLPSSVFLTLPFPALTKSREL